MHLNKTLPHRQTGLSLVELLVGLAIGLIIIGASLTVYVNAVRSGSDTLRSAKINMELRGAMNIMVAEIRRSGYWPATGVALATNPFTQAATDIAAPTAGCLVFTYDKNGNSTVDSAEYFGFKLSSSAIMMRFSGSTNSDCTSGSWESLTDPKTVIIDTLTFTTSYQCLNAQTNASEALSCSAANTVYNTAAAATGKSDLIEIRNIAITVTAHHINDAATRIELTQTVRVRNDRIQTVGV